VALNTALDQAVQERGQSGRRLLRENPLHGVPFPKEKNPRQPIVTHDEYLRLLEVAAGIDPLLHLALVVAEGTGRKGYSVADIAAAGGWRDVDTLYRSYLTADPEVIRKVVTEPINRLVPGG
jgi:hypothetical protein